MADADSALPEHIQQAAARAMRLECWVIATRLSAVALLGLAAFDAHGVRAIWVRNILGLLPPLAFLLGQWIEQRPPDVRFPFGLYRANVLAHLVNGFLLTALALYVMGSAAHNLVIQTHPVVQFSSVAGARFWRGWLIILALVYAGMWPFILSRLRNPLAHVLHDKALLADSVAGRVAWLGALAATLGLLGIHAGVWWADYIAASAIGLVFLYFGMRISTQAALTLVDERPRTITGNAYDPLPEQIEKLLARYAWVESAEVRLRDEGRMLSGQALVRTSGEVDTCEIQAAREAILSLNWRLHDFSLTPLAKRIDTKIYSNFIYRTSVKGH